MKWFWFFIIAIIVWGMFKDSLRQAKEKTNRPKQLKDITAQGIADQTTTLQQYRSLEKRLKTSEESLLKPTSDKKYKNACKKHDLLVEALNLAYDNVRRWQFVPEIGPNTSLVHLENAYKVFSQEQIEVKKKELSDDKSDWISLGPDDEPEEKEEGINSLISFRKIVEAELPKNEKIKKINQLVRRKEDFWEEYFNVNYEADEEPPPGEQWFLCEVSS